MEVDSARTEEVAAVLAIGVVIGVITYFQTDLTGTSRLFDAVLGAVVGGVAAVAGLWLFRRAGWTE